MIIDRKIRVFISSKCGGKYTVARKALQAMLDDSGFCDTYAFETDYSSSRPVVSAYLNELADSDVIIVFIDNEDGVTDPVQSEINRARELKKKILFFFCNETELKPTVLQTQLKEGLLEKYNVCHEFADFPRLAYNSFFNDITKLYRKTDGINTDELGVELSKDSVQSDFIRVKKDNLNNITSVLYKIKKMSGICLVDEDVSFDDLDETIGDLFDVVLGIKRISEVDISILEKYWSDLYGHDFKDVINARKEALINYLSGNYKLSLKNLSEIIKSHEERIPRWMLNDIAIDVRNIEILINKRKGVGSQSLNGQKILDSDDSYIFNPMMDRFNGDFYQELSNLESYQNKDFSGSIMYGRDEKVFETLANTIISSINCISITHLLLAKNKICKLFEILSFQYREHSLFINVVKMYVLECDEKGLKNYLSLYGESTNLISREDVLDIQLIVDNNADETNRIRAQAILLEFFAYYYDDELFLKAKDCLFVEAKNLVKKGYSLVLDCVIRALTIIDRRVAPREILDFLYFVIDGNYSMWHNEAVKAIRDIDTLGILSVSDQKVLIRNLKGWIADKEFLNKCNSLLDTAQKVRMVLGENAKSLDVTIKKYAPEFYYRPYSINVFEYNNAENSKYLLELIKSAKEKNRTQGVSGVYSCYSYDDYATIGNIIQNSKQPINFKIVSKVVDAIEETLRIDTQTCDAKFSALRLLILVQIVYPRNKKVKQLLQDIESFDEIIPAHGFLLQKKYTNASLEVMWKLLRAYVCEDDIDSLITDMHRCSEAEKIAIMDSLCVITRPVNKKKIDGLIELIWPGLLLFEISGSPKMKFFLAIIYSNLYGTSFENKALSRLIVILEHGTSDMKIGSISRLKSRCAKGVLVDYIYQQGRVDNHFCVREVANI